MGYCYYWFRGDDDVAVFLYQAENCLCEAARLTKQSSAFVNIAAGLLHAGRSQWRFLGKRLNSRPFSLQFQSSLVKKEKLFFCLFP